MHIPLTLAPQSQILVCGGGGGYDVVCALPLALALKEQGHQVHLASYSFTELESCQKVEQPVDGLYAVRADSEQTEGRYFPECYLAQWWKKEFSEDITVWSYRQLGVAPLRLIFTHLRDSLDLNTIIILDAGVDGLFEGTEHELGTPSIDAISIFAATALEDVQGYFVTTAFGTEGYKHKVRHADALMRMAQQVALKGMLGVSALLPQQQVCQQFRRASEHVHGCSGTELHSNMVSSLVAATKGKFGHQDLTVKTTQAPIWVSPLTLLYWYFDLQKVAQAKPFFSKAMKTNTISEIVELFEEQRETYPRIPRLDIPI